MSLSKKQVILALSQVEEPDLKKDLVTLNMIRDLEVSGTTVRFTVVLTTPACPLKDLIHNACVTAIHHLVDPKAEVIITMTAEVRQKTGNRTLLPGVAHVIAVASGKGGVGKSTVAANLALALAQSGATVGLLDADIHGPSVPMMFGLEGSKPYVEVVEGKQWILPLEQHGIKVMSIGFLVDAGQAVVWRGPMASKALTQFLSDVSWGNLDYLVIDLPPGTGDIHLTLVQQLPQAAIVLVSTPQQVALADARKGLDMFLSDAIKAPVLGIVENMAWFEPDNHPGEKYFIFGKGGAEALAVEKNLPFLGAIPIWETLRTGGDQGTPAVLNDDRAKAVFGTIASAVAQRLSILNA